MAADRPRLTQTAEARERLEEAVARLTESDLSGSLHAIAEELPLAVGVDFANIRLADDTGRLYLVAAAGCSSTEIRRRAFNPLVLGTVRDTLSSGAHDELARSLGIPWIFVAWIPPDGDPVGAFAVGARTRRRPVRDDLAYLEHTARELAIRVAAVDRSSATLEAASLRLARRYEPPPWPSQTDPVRLLRPRERNILELYADGLTTADIADLLVISRHTIRTHVRNALRTLGVHTREEAATLVRADQIAQLL